MRKCDKNQNDNHDFENYDFFCSKLSTCVISNFILNDIKRKDEEKQKSGVIYVHITATYIHPTKFLIGHFLNA